MLPRAYELRFPQIQYFSKPLFGIEPEPLVVGRHMHVAMYITTMCMEPRPRTTPRGISQQRASVCSTTAHQSASAAWNNRILPKGSTACACGFSHACHIANTPRASRSLRSFVLFPLQGQNEPSPPVASTSHWQLCRQTGPERPPCSSCFAAKKWRHATHVALYATARASLPRPNQSSCVTPAAVQRQARACLQWRAMCATQLFHVFQPFLR